VVEHVREALARYAGDIDAFELDKLIHHSKRATQKLSTFCTAGRAHGLDGEDARVAVASRKSSRTGASRQPRGALGVDPGLQPRPA